MPTKFYLQLFDTMQTTSNTEFNMIFEHWKRKSIVADKEVAIDTILNRATDVYQSHLDKKTWLSSSKKSALIFNLGSEENSESDTDHVPTSGGRNAERAAAAALQAPGPRPSGRNGPHGNRRNTGPPTPGVERIRTFRICNYC